MREDFISLLVFLLAFLDILCCGEISTSLPQKTDETFEKEVMYLFLFAQFQNFKLYCSFINKCHFIHNNNKWTK